MAIAKKKTSGKAVVKKKTALKKSAVPKVTKPKSAKTDKQITTLINQSREERLAIWEQTEKSKKEWLIFKSLYSISPALDGKLRNFDVQDYGFIVEYFVRVGFGPYWQEKDSLPSLLDNDIPLIVPMNDDD